MTGKLTILSIAYPFATVGPDAAGGAEQILSTIDRALVATGHASLVIAAEGSTVAGVLLPIPAFAGGAIEQRDRDAVHRRIRAVTESATRDRPIDLIHLHGVDFDAYMPPPGPPVLVTLHLPPEWYPVDALHPARASTWLHGVSLSQDVALRRIANHVGILAPIPNGVDTAAFGRIRHARRSFLLMLGRICLEKGQHIALDAATIARVPLLLAGEVFPYEAHRSYFQKEIVPRLGDGRRWIGPAGFTRKRRLLAAARCVLIPSLAPETSSLVAMEAIASGTPVIAFPSGALPDIVQDGVTGFIVHDAKEMAAAIREVERIDSAVCRCVAREQFSVHDMTGAYLRLYRQLAHATVPA